MQRNGTGPGPSGRARGDRRAILLLASLALVAGVFPAGCSKKPPRAAAPRVERHGPAQVLVDETPLNGVKVDTLYRQIATNIQGTPALNRPGQWLIVHTWYRTLGMPESLFTMDDLLHLEARGGISDTTMIGFVFYRYLTAARNLREATAGAEARMRGPDWPPQRLRAALRGPAPGPKP